MGGMVEIIAYGVLADERPLLETAFEGSHHVRCLDL